MWSKTARRCVRSVVWLRGGLNHTHESMKGRLLFWIRSKKKNPNIFFFKASIWIFFSGKKLVFCGSSEELKDTTVTHITERDNETRQPFEP
jgi:hypothetical protein